MAEHKASNEIFAVKVSVIGREKFGAVDPSKRNPASHLTLIARLLRPQQLADPEKGGGRRGRRCGVHHD